MGGAVARPRTKLTKSLLIYKIIFYYLPIGTGIVRITSAITKN